MELVVAMTDNFVIGANGEMPWHLPADLQHFKTLTSGSAVAMGRRTWESIGRPLPNRTNIVISRQRNYDAIGGTVVHSLEDAIRFAPEQRVFVIGGGEIYKAALPFATALHITRIHTSIDGDTFFPEFDTANWSLARAKRRPADDENCHDLTFELWSVRT
jgi:dihydrofolate reductase